MPKLRVLRPLARWVVFLALAAPVTPLGIGSPVPALSAAAPLGATVSVLSLPVDVATTEPGAMFAPAIDGQTLIEGDTVRTGPGGMALVTFFDGSESQLGGESQVQIEQVRATPAPQIAFLQTAGVTVNHVIPMPAEGSFRTDTPAATGLVRGTSYIVIVDSGAASIILLTDRNGHVGRVDVTANRSSVAAVVPLSKAGDAATAANATTTAAHLEPAALAHLESEAHVRSDPTASRATEQDARAIAATLLPQATGAPATQPPAAAVPVPQVATGQHIDRNDSGSGDATYGGAHTTAPAPAPTISHESVAAPSRHTDPAPPPKATAPVTVAHVDTSKASGEGSSTAKLATVTSPVALSTSSESDNSSKSAKASDTGKPGS